MHSLTLELSLSLMQGPRRSLSLSHLLSLVRSFKITGTKVVGSLMFVQGPIHLYWAWSRLHNKDTVHVQLFRSGYYRNPFPPADGASEMGVTPISTPLTFMWLDACMRMTDGKKMMSAFFGRYNLQYPPLFVFELHRIRSGRMINIETRASILLIHL